MEVEHRPLIGHSLEELRDLAEELRAELAHRSTPGANRLRDEIDPDFSVSTARDCGVYVIELQSKVRLASSFAKKNPEPLPDRPCLYVGSTSNTPEARLEQHRLGEASRIVKKFGCGLRPEFFERYPSMTRDQAEEEERALARLLRREGYGVWQE